MGNKIWVRTGFAVLIVCCFLLAACDGPRVMFSPTPMPEPTLLVGAQHPQPEGTLGGLDAIFISRDGYAGGQGRTCHTLYRFYPDGVLLQATECYAPDSPEMAWEPVSAWLHADNAELLRGDYFVQGERLLVRVVSYDILARAPDLEFEQGKLCRDRMLLQSWRRGPAALGARPIREYRRLNKLDDVASPSRPDALPDAAACSVPAYRFLWQSGITLTGGKGRYEIQTDPGQLCTLRYVLPDGTPGTDVGTGSIYADDQGVCAWLWDAGDVAGEGVVTVIIDEFEQDYLIIVNQSSSR